MPLLPLEVKFVPCLGHVSPQVLQGLGHVALLRLAASLGGDGFWGGALPGLGLLGIWSVFKGSGFPNNLCFVCFSWQASTTILIHTYI